MKCPRTRKYKNDFVTCDGDLKAEISLIQADYQEDSDQQTLEVKLVCQKCGKKEDGHKLLEMMLTEYVRNK